MATASSLVSLAQSQIGVKENPPNSNMVLYASWYGMPGQPWCDMFVSWLANQVGQKDIGKFAYCPNHVNYFKNQGLWLGRTTDVLPGDVVFFAQYDKTYGCIMACHVGIVEKKIDNNTVQTIEGNTSVTSNDNGGAVMRRTRVYGTVCNNWHIMGFARPKYDPETKGQWVRDNVGWWYRNPDGTWPRNCWRLLNYLWYWFDDSGYAATEWRKVDGKWYYFNLANEGVECAMVSNEVRLIDGSYYAFNADGAMIEGSVPVSTSGALIL